MSTTYTRDVDPLGIASAANRGYHILIKHRLRMILFFCGTMALVIVGLILCSREYVSESRLLVRVGRENIGLDPTATTGQTIGMQESRENEITSILDILGSRVVQERVVDELGASLILDGVAGPIAPEDVERVDPAELDPDEALLREKAIKHLNGTLAIDHTRKSNVIGLSYVDRSPELSRQILRSFINHFLAVHIAANRSSGSFRFFEDQAELIRVQFETASMRLNKAKDAINAVSIEQRRLALQNHLSKVETDTLTTQADLDAVNGTIAELRKTLLTLPQKSMTQQVTGFPDDAVGTTRKRLYELELREEQLMTRFTEHYPEVIAVRNQIAAARRILNNRAETGSQQTNADNPAYQQLHLKLLDHETQASGFESKLSGLSTQFDSLTAKLKSLNAQETKIAELQQQTDLFREKYNTYSESLEQSRMDLALEEGLISNVSVVQPPTFVPKPVSPKKAITLIVGFMFGCVGAVCFAFLSEYLEVLRADAAAPPEVPAWNTEAQPEVTRSERQFAETLAGTEALIAQARS